MFEMSKYKLVKVDWVDSAGGTRWVHLESNLPVMREPDLSCQSVGWLIHKDSQSLTLVPHFSFGTGEVRGDMTIPMRAVTKIRYIKESK